MPPKENTQPEPAQREPLVCINVPEAQAIREPHTLLELTGAAKNHRASRIANEFEQGLQFIKKYPKSVTFYGSSRFQYDNPHYKDAYKLAQKLSKSGYAIVTGGGPGIMEAANRGAKEAGGPSVGLNIQLPREQIINPYVTDSLSFYYFFSRKTTLSFSAEAYIFYPGGYGTLDEFFEIITLIQTHKIHRVPVFLVGSEFWLPLDRYMEEFLQVRHGAIEEADLHLYIITDDHEEVLRAIEQTPPRQLEEAGRNTTAVDS